MCFWYVAHTTVSDVIVAAVTMVNRNEVLRHCAAFQAVHACQFVACLRLLPTSSNIKGSKIMKPTCFDLFCLTFVFSLIPKCRANVLGTHCSVADRACAAQ